MAFSSTASNLVPGDTNGTSDIFVHDRVTEETTRISVDSNGNQANGNSYRPQLSGDGNLVVFESLATDLVPNDANSSTDVFVHDRTTGTTTRVSVKFDGTEYQNGGNSPQLSQDGSHVSFLNQMPGGNFRVFVRDLVTGQNTRVDVNSNGDSADATASGTQNARLSADGRIVTFASKAGNLAPAMTSGVLNVFVRDIVAGTTELVTLGYLGNPADGESGGFFGDLDLSADGAKVFFTSRATNLVPGDTNFYHDAFVHDRNTGETQRVSVKSNGEQAGSWTHNGSISGDGKMVSLATYARLVPADTDTRADCFVHDLETGEVRRITQGFDGNPLNGDCLENVLSADGRSVVFRSFASNLVPEDTNDRAEVFLHGPEIDLRASPASVAPGDTLELLTFGGVPGNPVLLFVTAVNGTSTFLNTGVGSLLDAHGAWSLSAPVPSAPGLSGGVAVSLRVLSIGSQGGIVQTDDATVTFE